MSGSEPGQREVARRVFAAEFGLATHSFSIGNEDRAPKYVLLPTGQRINRLFVVGVLTDVERVNDETVRARVADPTGAFVCYASQYQPTARATLETLATPSIVAITGKANTFSPSDSARVYTSIRPEVVAPVDPDTRDRWTVDTASKTIDRLREVAAVHTGTREPTGDQRRAVDIYDPTPAFYADLFTCVRRVLELVAEEIDTIETPSLSVDRTGDASPSMESLANIESADDSVDEANRTAGDDAVPDPVEAPDEPVVSEAERESVEAEFGTEFSTGNEVADPSADEAEDTNPLTAVLNDLDDGDGVPKETAIETAMDRYDLSRADAESSLESALLSGECYEMADERYRPI